MEEKVKKLIEKHKKDKDLTKEKIEAGWDWSEANLEGFNFKNLRLSSPDKPANFQEAKLENANFENTTLRSANFNSADLTRANFNNTNLQWASFIKTQLFEADFKEADMFQADMHKAMASNVNFNKAILAAANLKEAHFFNSNLEGADLSSVNFKKAKGDEANFRNANLFKANFDETEALKADFREANLEKVSAWGAAFYNANFERANLAYAHFHFADLRRGNFRGANLAGTYLDCAELYFCNFDKSNIEYAYITQENIYEISEKKLKNLLFGKKKRKYIYTNEEEQEFKKYKRILEEKKRFLVASDVYRNIKNTMHNNGAYNFESKFHYKEQNAFTKNLKKTGRFGEWLLHSAFKYLCGYGEKPLRVIGSFLFTIFIFGTLFLITGGLMAIPEAILLRPLDYYYFSLITAATLSFGDIVPNPAVGLMDIPWFRVAAMVEAFLGIFLMALFVIVAAKRIMR